MTTTNKVLPVETLSAKQVAWLQANGIEFSKGHHGVAGYCFGKGELGAVFAYGGFTVETADRSEDGDGARVLASDLSLRDALKMLVEAA